MVTKEDENDDDLPRDSEEASGEGVPGDSLEAPGSSSMSAGGSDEGAPAATTSLGSGRYVMAAFFLVGVLAAFLAGKLLGAGWSALAEWPAAVRTVPSLLSVSEDERGSITQIAGGVLGLLLTARAYRKESTRRWASEVAHELSLVTWPAKDVVTSGTVVVVATTVIITLYVTVLDKFWGFVTDLIYRV